MQNNFECDCRSVEEGVAPIFMFNCPETSNKYTFKLPEMNDLTSEGLASALVAAFAQEKVEKVRTLDKTGMEIAVSWKKIRDSPAPPQQHTKDVITLIKRTVDWVVAVDERAALRQVAWGSLMRAISTTVTDATIADIEIPGDSAAVHAAADAEKWLCPLLALVGLHAKLTWLTLPDGGQTLRAWWERHQLVVGLLYANATARTLANQPRIDGLSREAARTLKEVLVFKAIQGVDEHIVDFLLDAIARDGEHTLLVGALREVGKEGKPSLKDTIMSVDSWRWPKVQ